MEPKQEIATTGKTDTKISTWVQQSQSLIGSLIKMNLPATKEDGKMELLDITSNLMPKGAPNYQGVIKYPSVERLCQEYGKKSLRLAILMLVRDLCNSLNVVRNMNEDQMIEAACMLLDECGDFRLEDYVMMFSLAKRGQLVKIMDRIDIDTIGKILDEYWKLRSDAGKRAQEAEIKEYENRLRQVEIEAREQRNRKPESEEERIQKEKDDKQQDEFFAELKRIAASFTSKPKDDMKKYEERDALIKRQQENLRSQVKSRMDGTLKILSGVDEKEAFPDGVINDMVFLLNAHTIDWKNLVSKEMSISVAKLDSIVQFKNTDATLRTKFILQGKIILGI